MEFFGYLVVLFFAIGVIGLVYDIIVGVIRRATKIVDKSISVVAPDSNYAKSRDPDSFTLNVKVGWENFSGKLLEVFSVSFKGLVRLPGDNTPVSMTLLIKDETSKSKPGFVLCSIDELQEDSSMLFKYTSSVQEIPYENTIFTEDFPLAAFPIDLLQFQKKGERKLRFILMISHGYHEPEIEFGGVVGNKEYIYAIATDDITFDNLEFGYEDLKANEKRIEELTLFLAMYVSGIDGEFHEDEGGIIREWIKKKIFSKRLSDDDVIEEKRRFNSYVKKAYKDAESNIINVKKCTDELKEISIVADHYDVLELCMHVASADGKAEGKELEAVKDIADKLNLDMGRIREMQDKILPIAMHVDKADDEAIVGVTSEMSKEEIRKHLNSEYRKWNSQTTHRDEKIRNQAEEMIKVISELRTKYVN